jgi:hypothetical protein
VEAASRAGLATLVGVGIGLAVPAAAGDVPSFTTARATLRGHGCPEVVLDDVVQDGPLGVSAADVNATSPFTCQDPFVNFPWDGFALADVDLLSGQLHAVAFASTPEREAGGTVISTLAQAIFADTITLHGEGPGLLGVTLAVDGTMESTGMGVFTLSVCFGTSTGDVDPSTVADCETRDNFNLGNTVVGVPTEPTDFAVQLGGAQAVTPEPVNLYANLIVQAYDGWHGGAATMNFANTAQLAIAVPDGYTFTSESGLLLADEPWAPLQALVVCGAGLVASRRRLRGATRDAAPPA